MRAGEGQLSGPENGVLLAVQDEYGSRHMPHRTGVKAAQYLAPSGWQGMEGVAGEDGRLHHLGRVEPAQQPVVPAGQPVRR